MAAVDREEKEEEDATNSTRGLDSVVAGDGAISDELADAEEEEDDDADDEEEDDVDS